ncbi:MAG: flippase [Anaerolineae bacterium]|nr:flippase [Anaerolineae bacterium]
MSDTLTTSNPAPKTGRIIARNTLFGIGSQIALKIASFLISNILVINTLGAEQFGQYSIVLAWAGLFSVLGDLGVSQYLSREIARDRSKTSALFWDTVVLRFIFAVLASAITTIGAITIAGYPSEIVLAIVIYTSTYYLQAFLQPLISILMGNERIDIISVLSMASQIIIMILSALFVLGGLDFIWLIVAQLVVIPLMIFLHYRAVRRNKLGPPKFHINTAMWRHVIIAGLPFAIVQLSLSFSYQVDVIFLRTYWPDEVVGWYSTAYSLTLTLLFLPRAFNDAILPSLSREHATNPLAINPWYYTSVRFIIMMGIPMAIGGMLLADKIITLIYKPEFLPAALAFAIIIWDLPFVMYTSFSGNISTAVKRERNAAFIFGTTGILNIILNAILVPQLSLVGACFATVLTDMFSCLQFYLLLRGELGQGLKLHRLLRALLAALIMGLVIIELRDLFLPLTIVIAGVVYVMIIWFIGALTEPEQTSVKQLVGRVANRVRLRGQQT